MWLPCSPMGAQPSGLHCNKPMEFTFARHMYLLVMVHDSHLECTEWLLLPLLPVEGRIMLLIQLSQAVPSICWDIQLWGLGRELPNPSTFPIWWEGSSLPGCVPPNDTVNSESVVGIKPGDSSMVIGFQIDEFTCIWLAQQFVAQSHI